MEAVLCVRSARGGVAADKAGLGAGESTKSVMWRVTVGYVVLVAAMFTVAGTAAASGALKLCVPKKEGSAVVTPKRGKCSKGYRLTSSGVEGQQGKAGPEGKAGAEGKAGPEGKAGTGLSSSELETLRSLLPHIRYLGTGVGGKPTVRFSGVNVQVVNGEGRTASTNGTGLWSSATTNRKPRRAARTISSLEASDQEFTSYGGILAGTKNAIAAVRFGARRTGEQGDRGTRGGAEWRRQCS